MAEREVAGKAYEIGRLDAMTQFHVVRRLTPIMGKLVEVLGAQQGGVLEPLEALVPLSEAISAMKDEDAEYVIKKCLSVVRRQNEIGGTGWSAVQASNGRLMFDDIRLPEMLQLTFATIQENLADFFPLIAQLSTGASPAG